MTTLDCTYEVDHKGRIVGASDEFCRVLQCTRPGLMGRDLRDLLRPDFRPDFRMYVSRAMVGVGSLEIMVPIVAPGGDEGWFRHILEPRVEEGRIAGYRASVIPPRSKAATTRKWWQWRSPEPRLVWNFEPAKA